MFSLSGLVSRWFILVLLFALLSSCNIFDASESGVEAKLIFGTLHVENNTDDNIYHFAVGEQTSWVIDWAPFIREESRIKPGKTRILTAQKMMLQDGDTKIYFYWWKAKLVDGELVADNMQSREIAIK